MTQADGSAIAPASRRGMFVRWYLAEVPVGIVRGYVAYAYALSEAFSILFLLRTLFSPWKNIVDAYPTKGFNLERILETLALNMTARGIGAVIRITVILAGIAMQVACLAVTAALLVLWLFFPVLSVGGVAYVYLSFFL
jgi:hypothetical protein